MSIQELNKLSDFDIGATYQKQSMAIIGLGATGSAFLPHLAHYLRYHSDFLIALYDFDVLETHNNRVSMYLFDELLTQSFEVDNTKVSHATAMLRNLVTEDVLRTQNHEIAQYNEKASLDTLTDLNYYCDSGELDYIFVFTDNTRARYEIGSYQILFPHTTIFDVRIGTYREFEVFVSTSGSGKEYMKTIPMKDGKPLYVETNGVCLDQRMSFSIAQSASALLANLLVQYEKDELRTNNGLYHFMFGQDYIGELKYK